MQLVDRNPSITYSREEPRCDRCNLLLSQSQWNDTHVVFSTSQNRQSGFLCVHCAVNPHKTKHGMVKQRIVADEVEDYVKKLARMASDFMYITLKEQKTPDTAPD